MGNVFTLSVADGGLEIGVGINFTFSVIDNRDSQAKYDNKYAELIINYGTMSGPRYDYGTGILLTSNYVSQRDLINHGTIFYGVELRGLNANQYVLNSGEIYGGLYLSGGIGTTESITNTGSINDGEQGSALVVSTRGTVAITNSGYIDGISTGGVEGDSGNSYIINQASGSIAASVFSDFGGTLINDGRITDIAVAVEFGGVPGTFDNVIDNNGYIATTGQTGVEGGPGVFVSSYGTGTSINNAGTILGPSGIRVAGGSYTTSIVNSGIIRADVSSTFSGITFAVGGGVALTSSFETQHYGIYLENIIVNTGTISGGAADPQDEDLLNGYGVYIFSGTVKNLGSSALISSYYSSGVQFQRQGFNGSAPAYLLNQGSIVEHGTIGIDGAYRANGVDFYVSGMLNNSGLIYAGNSQQGVGVLLHGAGPSTIENSGTIIGYSAHRGGGVVLALANTYEVAISNSGTIIGEANTGLRLTYQSNSSNYVLNTGTIIGDNLGPGVFYVPTYGNGLRRYGDLGSGVDLVYSAGTFANLGRKALITSGAGAGIGVDGDSKGQALTIVNQGIISQTGTGVAYGAVFLKNVFYSNLILNEAGGVLENTNNANSAAVVSISGTGTIDNFGTIRNAGTGYAVVESNGDTFIYHPGSVVDGIVDGGGSYSTLVLGGSGTFSGLGSQYVNFGTVAVGAGVTWDLPGKFDTGIDVLNDGTIKESSTNGGTIAGSLTGSGVVQLSKKLFALDGGVAKGQTIAFTGTGETLALGDPTLFGGTVAAFKAGDTIDLTAIKFSAIKGTHFAKGELTIDSTAGDFHLKFASPASFGKDTFKLFADGKGTGITLSGAGAALPALAPAYAVPVASAAGSSSGAGWLADNLVNTGGTSLTPLVTLGL